MGRATMNENKWQLFCKIPNIANIYSLERSQKQPSDFKDAEHFLIPN